MKYTKGSKWIAVDDSGLGWYSQGLIATCTKDSDYSLTILLDNREASVSQSNFIPYVEPVVDPVADAKLALDNAQKAYDLEVIKAQEAKKFTEDDIKNLMVVRLSNSSWLSDKDSLRVVTFSPYQAIITGVDGSYGNTCSREFLLSKLNAMYTKTNLTLKEALNAI